MEENIPLVEGKLTLKSKHTMTNLLSSLSILPLMKSLCSAYSWRSNRFLFKSEKLNIKFKDLFSLLRGYRQSIIM